MSPFPRLLIGYNIFANVSQKCVIISKCFLVSIFQECKYAITFLEKYSKML